MKVFITGWAGHIGKHLVRRMSRTMHTIRCMASTSSELEELSALGVNVIGGDLTNRDALREGMHGCDWVINLAELNSYWEPDNDLYRRIHVEGTRTVMECALEAEVSKVVHVSSIEIYGKPRESPFRESTHEGLFRFSHYSRTRYEGDHIAWLLYQERNLPLVAVYPCAALGSEDAAFTGKVIRRLIERRMPARLFPHSIFTFVHVDDVAETILRAAEKPDNLGERYFAGNTRLTLGDLYDMVSDISGVHSPILTVPGSLAMPGARILTWFADRIKRPPLFDLSTDAVRTMREGFMVDGSKVESELGIAYTSVRKAVEEECEWFLKVRAETWEGQERRAEMRSRVDVPCDVKGLSQGRDALTKAHVVDLTHQGMFVAADTLLDEGTEIDAEIALLRYGNTFWVRGKVLRRTEEGMAVKFTEKVPLDIKNLME